MGAQTLRRSGVKCLGSNCCVGRGGRGGSWARRYGRYGAGATNARYIRDADAVGRGLQCALQGDDLLLNATLAG